MRKKFFVTDFFKWPRGSSVRCFAAKPGCLLRQILFLLLYFLGWATAAQAAIPASERTVLTSLYSSTNGASWTNRTNWNGAVGTECTWFGVTCNGTQTNVTQINLPSNNLVGTLPSLGSLTAIQQFIVYGNQLSGSIPSLTGLTSLQVMRLDDNRLTGSIPSLAGLAALQYFNVGNNLLTGTLPSLGGLTALLNFSAYNNQLTGPIPSLSGRTALAVFFVNGNQLSGSIPSLSGLTALRLLQLQSNQLTGAIPSLSGLTALESFQVQNNLLTGSIPALSGLPALRRFYAGNNQLSGSIPSLALSYLQYFWVENNRLTGPVPTPTDSLLPGQSALCGNSLVSSGSAAIDNAWVTFTGVNWLACQTAALVAPVCTLSASPASIAAGNISTLTASCSPAAASYSWTGGTCAGTTGAVCSVSPSITTTYSVRGSNAAGAGNIASATVTVTAAATPVCNLAASPKTIAPGATSTLIASCSPAVTSYIWTGGTCAGTNAANCTVKPAATTTYTVRASNAAGTGSAVSATVTVTAPVFPMTVTSNITPTVSTVTAFIQFRPQDVGTTGNVYVFALAPRSIVRNVPLEAANSHKGPVAQGINSATSLGCVLAQLINGQLMFATADSLQAYLTGVLTSQGLSVSILNSISTPLIQGAVFYVGYGRTSSAMINNGTSQSVVNVTGTQNCQPQAPQTGWWWNRHEDGRGFGIEVRGNNLFMSGYLYDDSGHATWIVSPGPVALDGSLYNGTIYQVANGQSLTGVYKKPAAPTVVGTITLSFSDARNGTIVWPGGLIPIERFDDTIGSGNGVTPSFVPENGWWWNPSEDGRGFFLEIKNNFAFIAGYMYETDGRPVWYVAQNTMTSPQAFNGTWLQVANGQTMTGPWKPFTIVNSNVGPALIYFTDTTNAIMTLPNGRQIPITRHQF